jgi:hypothetical protein
MLPFSFRSTLHNVDVQLHKKLTFELFTYVRGEHVKLDPE